MKITKWFSENLSFGRKYLRTTQRQLSNLITEFNHDQSYTYWWDRTLHCQERGVSDEKLCQEEVVVSLTSYGDRIHNVHLAIESIMQQTVRPNRIILWLSEEEFKGKTLPISLQRQQERGLEIDFCQDLKPYKKLIPSLNCFPDACIITVDDDHAYYPNLVEKMINAHVEHPSDICASRVHEILLDSTGKPMPYLEWKQNIPHCPANNNRAFFTGGGGVLYPPGWYSDEVFNEEVFMCICDRTDDIWFNAMRLLTGVQVTKVFSASRNGDYQPLSTAEVNSLWSRNRESLNDKAIAAVYGHYGLFEKLKDDK